MIPLFIKTTRIIKTKAGNIYIPLVSVSPCKPLINRKLLEKGEHKQSRYFVLFLFFRGYYYVLVDK